MTAEGLSTEAERELAAELGKRRILVIDDDERMRRTLCLVLEQLHCSGRAAEDGESGVALFEKHHRELDAILLDLTMPGLSGVETLARLRDVDAQVPVVLMSGYNEEEASSRFAKQKPAGFLAKPFRAEDLKKALDLVLT